MNWHHMNESVYALITASLFGVQKFKVIVKTSFWLKFLSFN